jgi:hypothetical protein
VECEYEPVVKETVADLASRPLPVWAVVMVPAAPSPAVCPVVALPQGSDWLLAALGIVSWAPTGPTAAITPPATMTATADAKVATIPRCRGNCLSDTVSLLAHGAQ